MVYLAPDGLGPNGLSADGLSTGGLSADRLSTGGLSANGLSTNGLIFGMTNWMFQQKVLSRLFQTWCRTFLTSGRPHFNGFFYVIKPVFS